MKKLLFLLFLTVYSYIFSQNNILHPSSYLGYTIGEQFSRHNDVVNYFKYVSENSKLVNYHSYGATNERRRLTYAIVSSEENIKKISTIRLDNLKSIGLEEGQATPEIAIVWLSYNVHGNEASSTEAAMLTLYKLIHEKTELLKNTVVIIDPCLNPDGRDRYANWYNQTRAIPYQTNPSATEHNEPWPKGRPNHYLFDLNRDWAWATQIETQHRLRVYNKWMPHVHVDFHEQGINEPYYFAPAAAPFHEVISAWQKDFQTQIGKNNASYFDKEGWLFFTRESFDLLYPSYGDTYPTFMGSIGMTYEQAGHSRAGLGIQTDEGHTLTLKDRIAHHTTSGLSTVEISSKNAKKLNTEFKKFFTNHKGKYKSYVLNGEKSKISKLTKLLDKHEIKYGYTKTKKVSGYNYKSNKQGEIDASGALVVSTDQPKGKMVTVLFEPKTKIDTPLTYDITAWSIPHAYGLESIASKSLVPTTKKEAQKPIENQTNPNGPGYIAKWNSIDDATFLTDLLKNKIKVRFTEKDLEFESDNFKKGSLIITKSDNKLIENYDQVVIDIANSHQRQLFTATTSFSKNGVDFGSSHIKLINNQKIAVLKGRNTSSLNYGEIWHFFETELKYPITSIDTDYFKYIDLSEFDVLILPNGRYTRYIDKKTLGKLEKWISNGGKIIAIGNALSVFTNSDDFDIKEKKSKENENDSIPKLVPYGQREINGIKDLITGSVFKTKVDHTHPMAFGYDDSYFTLKTNDNTVKLIKDGYNVAYIQEPELVSGFAGKEILSSLKNTLVFGESKKGDGSIIYMVDNPLFRSFWENGKLFFVNSIFFTNITSYNP